MEAELRAWLQAWWAAHPAATLTEIEAKLDRQVAALRVQVLAETLAQGEGKVTAKYFLSPSACSGILRRAEKRGKRLPARLEAVLRAVAGAPPTSTAPAPTLPVR